MHSVVQLTRYPHTETGDYLDLSNKNHLLKNTCFLLCIVFSTEQMRGKEDILADEKQVCLSRVDQIDTGRGPAFHPVLGEFQSSCKRLSISGYFYWSLTHTFCVTNKLSKKRNFPFSGPCLSKIIHKNPNNFTDLQCKGFKHCFPCLFNEP